MGRLNASLFLLGLQRLNIISFCNRGLPLLRRLTGLWQANDVRRPTFASDVLRRLPVTSIE